MLESIHRFVLLEAFRQRSDLLLQLLLNCIILVSFGRKRIALSCVLLSLNFELQYQSMQLLLALGGIVLRLPVGRDNVVAVLALLL